MGKFKKFILPALLCIILISAVYCVVTPEYRVYKIFSSDGADYRESDLHIIVYKPWNYRQTVRKAVEQFKQMNGTPDRLTVWLYFNKRNVDNGREFYKEVFRFGKDEVSDPPGVWEEQPERETH